MKFNRLLIPNIEARILVGITMFVTIMILIGWVAINEPSRMAAFEQRNLARSIERGAELFAANCATCHNADGRGQAGRAPGLNNPHMFGYNYLAEVNGAVLMRERALADLRDRSDVLTEEREDLFEEIAMADADRQAAITTRLQEIDAELNPATEGSLGASIATIEEELVPLYEERETQLAQLEEAFFKNYMPRLEEVREQAIAEDDPRLLSQYIAGPGSSRLAQVGWEGDLTSFLTTTLIHGRPGSADVWGGNQMVAWGQTGGGPLRRDQVDDIVNYILNWDKGDNWDMADLYAVNQFGKIKADAALVAAGGGEGPQPVGTQVDPIVEQLAEVTGDAARGELLYNGQERAQGQPVVLACSSCHEGAAQAPGTIGTWSRVQNDRLALAEFAGYTVEQYLVESIVRPNDYISPGYNSGIMPQTYGEQLSAQDLADLLAYLETQG